MDHTVTYTASHVMTVSGTTIVINLVNVYVIMDGLETIAKFVSDKIHSIEATTQRCFKENIFRKYAADLQENTHADV